MKFVREDTAEEVGMCQFSGKIKRLIALSPSRFSSLLRNRWNINSKKITEWDWEAMPVDSSRGTSDSRVNPEEMSWLCFQGITGWTKETLLHTPEENGMGWIEKITKLSIAGWKFNRGYGDLFTIKIEQSFMDRNSQERKSYSKRNEDCHFFGRRKEKIPPVPLNYDYVIQQINEWTHQKGIIQPPFGDSGQKAESASISR